MYNPYDATIGFVNTYIPWFVEQIRACKPGDLIMLWTDYIALGDEHGDARVALRQALSNKVYVVIGIDRAQACGAHFTCNGKKVVKPSCPDCSKSPNCMLCETGTCNNANSFIDLTTNGSLGNCDSADYLYIIDDVQNEQGTTPPPWYHSHRKVQTFFRQSGNSTTFKGSFNIDLNSGPRSLRETGVGISGPTSGEFMQNCIALEIAFLKALQFGNTPLADEKTIGTAGYKVALQILQKMQNGQDYPYLPVHASVSLQPPKIDGGNVLPTDAIKDENAMIWLGLNPPPAENDRFLPFLKDMRYPQGNSGTVQDWTGQSFDDSWAKMNRICNSIVNRADNSKTQPWASGFPWGGTLLLRVLLNGAARNEAVKVSVYNPFLDAGSPPQEYGCEDALTCDFQRQMGGGTLPPAVHGWMQVLRSNGGKSLQLSGGNYREEGYPYDPKQAWFPYQVIDPQSTAANGFSLDEKAKLFFRRYMTNPVWPYMLGCNYMGASDTPFDVVRCTQNRQPGCPQEAKGCQDVVCCKNHEKIWMNEKDVVFSSGHPVYDYYASPTWFNDDILIENAPGFAGYIGAVYDLMFERQCQNFDNNVDASNLNQQQFDMLRNKGVSITKACGDNSQQCCDTFATPCESGDTNIWVPNYPDIFNSKGGLGWGIPGRKG